MSETGGRNYIAGRPVNTYRPISPFLAGVFARRRPPAAIVHEFHVLPVDDVEEIFDDGNFFVHGLVLSARFILKRKEICQLYVETKGLRQRPLDGTVRFSEKGGCIQKRGEDSKRSKGAVVMATNLCVGAGEGGKQTRQKEEEEEEERKEKKKSTSCRPTDRKRK